MEPFTQGPAGLNGKTDNMQSGIVVGLVEDDFVQAELFAAMLAAGGLHPLVFDSVHEFRRRNGAESVDVLLLDWHLPGVSGIDLLKSLQGRAGSPLPVLLLTSNSDVRDMVYALQEGADDYIVKPPRAAELLARIKAVHRRVLPYAVRAISDSAPFDFCLRERTLHVDGVPVQLTEREFDLLAYLFQRVDRVVSRQMLQTEVWKLPASSSTRSVDTYVSRVRKRLALDGGSGWLLAGVYQVGYRLSRSARADGGLVDEGQGGN